MNKIKDARKENMVKVFFWGIRKWRNERELRRGLGMRVVTD